MDKDYTRKAYVLHEEDGRGKVLISEDVVAVIVGLAATEVKGVSSMAGNITNEIMAKVGRKNLSRGVKIQINGNRVKISLVIMMDFGYNIPGTCSKIQDKVKSAVENMTGLKVTDIDIRIAGVDMENK